MSFVESDKLSAGFMTVSIVKVTDTNVMFLRELRPKLLRIIPFTHAGSSMCINKLIGKGVISHNSQTFDLGGIRHSTAPTLECSKKANLRNS